MSRARAEEDEERQRLEPDGIPLNDLNQPEEVEISYHETDWADFKNQVKANQINQRFQREPFLNGFDGNHLKKPILLLSCGGGDFEGVTPSTIRLLITKGAETDYIDEKWYGWEAVHYAAYASNHEKLEAICENLGEGRINTLTALSENALHVLLEHGKLAQAFNVSCHNGQNSKMSKIISSEPKELIRCVEILINKGIDINHNNFWNETPVMIAIKRRYFKVIKLLHKKGVDLDSCKDPVSGKIPRELLEGTEIPGVVPTASVVQPPHKLLFQLLKSGDEDGFLKYNNGRIEAFVNKPDGDNHENSSCTLLQYCFRRSLIFWYQDKAMYEDEFQFRYQDITGGTRVVDVFCQSGMAKCMQHLLDNGADVHLPLRKFGNHRTLLQVAIIRGFYPVVALILSRREYDPPPNGMIDLICEAMVVLLKQRAKCVDLNSTLSIVLTRLVEWVRSSKISSTARINLIALLKDGVRVISKENQLLLLKLPGSLCWTTPIDPTCCWFHNSCWLWCCCCTKTTKKSVLEDMDPEVVKAHLDDCVENEGQIKINCESFLKEESFHSVFETCISSDGLKEYLNHSVFKILTMRQWENLRLQYRWPKWKYFYINLVFYACFYLFLNVYILCKFNGVTCTFLNMFLNVIGWMFLIVFMGKEVLQIVASCKLYFKEVSNYIEIVFIICAIIVYSTHDALVDIAEVLLVLSSNVVLLFLLVNVPACAKYVIILRTILFYIRYLIFYFIQFLAFSICFYILFSKKDQEWYKDIPDKIFETIILFTGNLDYMETPWKQESNNATNNSTSQELYHTYTFKTPFSKLVFITFVLFFAIILQNLLVGLLVIDMSNLHKDVQLTEQVKRASFVVRLQTFFKSPLLQKCLPKYRRDPDESKITIKDSDWKVLTDEEKQNLYFIISKRVKKPNTLRKMRNLIMSKINDRNCEGLRKEKSKEFAEKLEVIEEIVKNLNEMQCLKKNP